MGYRVVYAIVTYLLVLAILYQLFKRELFDPRYNLPFGIGKKQTLCPVYFAIPLIALIVFFIFALVELIS